MKTMKTNKATISIGLRRKKMSGGKSPIVMRVRWQRTQAVMTLPIECVAMEWDEKGQCISALADNHAVGNAIIARFRREAEQARDLFILEDKAYTASSIILAVKKRQRSMRRLVTLRETFSDMIGVSRQKSPATLKTYRNAFVSFLRCFGVKDKPLAEIDADAVQKYLLWLKRNERIRSANTCKEYVEKMSRIFSHAVDRGFSEQNPFRAARVGKKFHRVYKNQSLNEFQRNLLFEYFEERSGEMGFGRMGDKLSRPFSKEFALWFYLCGCTMQGLAPIDLALLRWDDMASETSEVWMFKLRRRKTGQPVDVAVWKSERNMSLLAPCIGRRTEGRQLLFPLMDGIDTDDAEAVERRENAVISGMASSLKKVWREFNRWIVARAEDGFDACLYNGDGTVRERKRITSGNVIDVLVDEQFTMYSYRHTFATIFMENGGTAYDLARLLGRTVASIDEYLASLPFNAERRMQRMLQLMG